MTTPAAAQTPEANATPEPPDIGFHIGRGDSEHFEAVRAAGGEFAVVVFSWADIEPAPNYLYWERPDAALRAAEFYGIDLIARLDQPPEWALDSGDPTPWRLEAYTNFVRRVADRYGDRLAGVVIWNEPNLNLEWNNQPPEAAAYVEMLKAAYPAVKSTAPELPVLMAGLASTEGEGDWAVNDLDYLEALYAAGVKDYFDIFTAHAYGFGRPPEDTPEKFRPNFRRLELLRNIMTANGDGDKPVWVTEMGWLIRSDDPEHDWQVVSPEQQAEYTLQAVAYAQNNYPWLKKLGIWQLNVQGDDYGYGIWHGPNDTTPAYTALVETCSSRSPQCPAAPPNPPISPSPHLPISILAPDSTIRLGDRGMLHPHWVHLHRGGRNFSPSWQGEFFLTAEQAAKTYDLLLETMQIDQATNRLVINDTETANLTSRPRPDPTSTWVTQRFRLPPDLLRAGVNTISIAVGPRNPARQYMAGRWENMQFRHIRLVEPRPLPAPSLTGWQPQPAPSGWSETNRLRVGLGQELWLTGNRPGELWRLSEVKAEAEVKAEIEVSAAGASDNPQFKPLVDAAQDAAQDAAPSQSKRLPGSNGPPRLENHAGNRPDLIFNDIVPMPRGQLAATQRGLFWRSDSAAWQLVDGAPPDHAYAAVQANNRFYAGFEGEGLWTAPSPTGPWQRTALTAAVVTDLVVAPYRLPDRAHPVDRLYAVTPSQIFVNDGLADTWQTLPLPALSDEEMDEAKESLSDKLKPRLYVSHTGQLLVRNQDRLWLQDKTDPTAWNVFGPEALQGKLYSVLHCCTPGETLVGSHDAGIWRLTAGQEWVRTDTGAFFDTTDVTELLQVEDRLYAAGDLGLFWSQDQGASWQKVEGLPATVSDLLVDPTDPTRWLAGTPAGMYRSRDAGRSWQAVSPPWTVWDMAFGPEGRLFVGRSNGLVWADNLDAPVIRWQPAEDMQRVYFLSVKPHPAEVNIVWSGTWGNNIAVSIDGGQSLEPLHNGLETLSGLDLLWHPTPGQVTLATIEGLYRTDDGGQSWFKLPGPLMQQTVHSLLQTGDGAIWAGAAGGLWVSRDYGVTWEPVNDLPQAAVIRLGKVTTPPPPLPFQPPFVQQQNEAKVYRSQEWLWAGTEGAGLWLSPNNGLTWHFAGLSERSVFNLFFDPLQPRHLVAATDQGIFAVAVPEKPKNP